MLRINYDKTQILHLGSLKNTDAKLITQGTISWSCRVKMLGIRFSADTQEMIQLNYEVLLRKMEKITMAWGNRDLTLIGKTLVINTLVASQYTYYFMNTYSPTPKIFDKMYKIVKNYFWGQGRTLIAYN